MTLPAREQAAASATIVLGILRGTVFGPIKSLDLLTSTYGLTWLVARPCRPDILLGLAGHRWSAGALERFNALELEQTTLADGSPNPAMVGLIADIKRKSQLELIFFLASFTCMILMRFGL